jgi:hypothetical protein
LGDIALLAADIQKSKDADAHRRVVADRLTATGLIRPYRRPNLSTALPIVMK